MSSILIFNLGQSRTAPIKIGKSGQSDRLMNAHKPILKTEQKNHQAHGRRSNAENQRSKLAITISAPFCSKLPLNCDKSKARSRQRNKALSHALPIRAANAHLGS